MRERHAPRRLRLFVAFDLPPGHIEEVNARVAELRSAISSARWTRSDQQHVTLKFIGSVEEDRLPDALDVCRTAAEGASRFELALGGLGAFPSKRRARVLWVGMEERRGDAARLATGLDRGFEALGVRREDRLFTPHLTLARMKPPQDLRDLPSIGFDDLVAAFVSEIVLYRSHLSRAGSTYEVVERFPLR